MASFTCSPAFVNVSSTGNVITLVGTSTAWVGGVTTFTVSGGTSPSITAQNITSTTAATVTLSAGTSAGTLAISDGVNTQTVKALGTFVSDTLVDTGGVLLENHTGQIGATWAKDSSFSAGSIVFTTTPGNGVRQNASGGDSDYYASGTPGTADYDVQATWNGITAGSLPSQTFVSGRNTGANSWYGFYYTTKGGTSNNTTSWCIAKRIGGGLTYLSFGKRVDTTLVQGTHTLRLSIRGQLLLGYLDGVLVSWAKDTSLSAAGNAGLSIFQGGLADNVYQWQGTYTATDVLAAATAIGLATPTGASATFVTTLPASAASGNIYAFMDGLYTGTVNFSDGGAGGTFTPSSLTYSASAAGQSFTYTPAAGSVGTTVTLTASATGLTSASANFKIAGAQQAIAYNDSHIYYPPYCWYDSGTYKECNAAGRYVKAAFTGTSFAMKVDPSVFGVWTTEPNVVTYFVDGGPKTDLVLDGGNVQTTYYLASGLASGNHRVEIYVSGVGTVDRWASPTDCIRIDGYFIDSGASMLNPARFKAQGILYGDSICEGVKILSNQVNNLGDYWMNEWDSLSIVQALGIELGVVAYSGQGYLTTGNGGVDTFNNAWDLYYSGQTRTFTDNLDFIFIEHGTNNTGGATTQADVQAMFTNLRTACPSAKIVYLIPFGQFSKAAIEAAIAAQADPLIYEINLGTNASGNVSSANNTSYDNLHPNALGASNISPFFIVAFQSLFPGFTPPKRVHPRMAGRGTAARNSGRI